MKVLILLIVIILYLHYTNNKKYLEIKNYVTQKTEQFKILHEDLLNEEHFSQTTDEKDPFMEDIDVSVDEVAVAAAQATIADNAQANPTVANPNVANTELANPNVANTELANPNVSNTTLDNSNVANTELANPNVTLTPTPSPNIERFTEMLYNIEQKHRYFGNVEYFTADAVDPFMEDIDPSVSNQTMELVASNAHTVANNTQNVSTPQGGVIATQPPAPITGCTDISALNYDASATVSDGSCRFT